MLSDRDYEAFKTTCLKSSLLILGISLVKSLKNFTARRLLVKWRRALCSHLQDMYLQGNNFYKVSVFHSFLIRNTDQRITADVNSLVTTYGDLIIKDLFFLPPKTVYYAYKVKDFKAFQAFIALAL